MSEKNSTVQIPATGETVCYVNSHGEPMAECVRCPRSSAGFWVRVRHYSGRARDYWSIQADTIEGRRETINLFVRFALEQGIAHEHQEAFMVGYDDGQVERYPFKSGGIGGYASVYL